MADPAHEGNGCQGASVAEDSLGRQPARPGVGTVPGAADGLEAGPHACRAGPDRVPLEGATRALCGVRTTAARGRAALAHPPSALAPFRGARDVRQPGVVARQLPPTDPRAK